MRISTVAAIMAAAGASTAFGTITITQGEPIPTYANTLTFDEGSITTGVQPDVWDTGLGVTITNTNGGPQVLTQTDLTNLFGSVGVGTDNTLLLFDGGGNNFDFGADQTHVSFEAWSNAGAPSPFFGGGIGVALYRNGVAVTGDGFNDFEIFTASPLAGGVPGFGFNVVATDNMYFDEMRIASFANLLGPNIIDNVSWVPAPGTAAALGLFGLAGLRRRR